MFAAPVESSTDLSKLNYLRDISIETGEDALTFHLKFSRPLAKNPRPEFFGKSVQIELPNAYIHPAKRYFYSDDSPIDQVYASQLDVDRVRVRFVYNASQTDMASNFRIRRKGSELTIRVDKNPDDVLDRFLLQASQAARQEEKFVKPQRTRKISSTQIEQTEEPAFTIPDELIPKTPSLKQVEPPVAAPSSVKPMQAGILPSGILDKKDPNAVALEAESKNSFLSGKSSKNLQAPSLAASGFKMFYTLALVLGVMFLVFFIFKKTVWKHSLGGDKQLVKVLGSGFLGPRKTISLVEVAGEILIVGISGDTITLLSNIKDEKKIEKIKSDQNGDPSKAGFFSAAKTKTGQPQRSGAAQGFASYMNKFYQPGPSKEASVDDVTAMIRRNLGKLKPA